MNEWVKSTVNKNLGDFEISENESVVTRKIFSNKENLFLTFGNILKLNKFNEN